MKKLDFFLAAMRAGEFRRTAWVISAFAITNSGPEDWRKEPYPWRIVQTPAGVFFVDPNNNGELSPLEGCVKGQAPFGVREHVDVTKDMGIVNLKSDINTTYGRLLWNYTILIFPFQDKIDYVNERTSPSKIEDVVVGRLVDTVAEGAERDKEKIYVDEYLLFTNAAFYSAGFAQICVPSGTPKSFVAAPGIVELKNKLIEENKDRLSDPAVIAKIDAQLVAYDREYLKGDLSEDFLLGKKAFAIVRKKLFGMHGAETGLKESVEVKLIKPSLSQGWDINHFPEMIESLRAGSFNRSAQTMLGGEAVKWLLRGSSNITVTEDDCGSKLGIYMDVTQETLPKLKGFTIVGEKARVTDEDAKSYLGKRVLLRSPMFCQLGQTDFCKVCVGDLLAQNPTALSSAVAEYGSTFLAIYMSAAHAKGLQIERMNFEASLT